MNKFRTKTGRLTAYAFYCGYREVKATKPHQGDEGLETTLWFELGCYHVRQNDWSARIRVFWESFPTLKEARDCFSRCKGAIVTRSNCAE